MQTGQDSDSLQLDGSANSLGLKVKKSITIHDSVRIWRALWCYLSQNFKVLARHNSIESNGADSQCSTCLTCTSHRSPALDASECEAQTKSNASETSEGLLDEALLASSRHMQVTTFFTTRCNIDPADQCAGAACVDVCKSGRYSARRRYREKQIESVC